MISVKDILQKESDFLFLLDGYSFINEENVSLLNSKIVVECSDGCITKKAEEYLSRKDILVLPDILLGAGNITASLIEYFKNSQFRDITALYTKWRLTKIENIVKICEKKLDL